MSCQGGLLLIRKQAKEYLIETYQMTFYTFINVTTIYI